MKKFTTLIGLTKFVRGFNLTPAQEKELMLCIVALNNNGIFIGDAVRIDNSIYLAGFRGLYTPELVVEKYEDFGYAYLEENAEKISKKELIKLNTYEGIVDALDDEYNMLRALYRERVAPKDLGTDDCRNIINDKDKQLTKLEDEYVATLKNVDLLSRTLVEQVKENKKLQAKVNKK